MRKVTIPQLEDAAQVLQKESERMQDSLHLLTSVQRNLYGISTAMNKISDSVRRQSRTLQSECEVMARLGDALGKIADEYEQCERKLSTPENQSESTMTAFQVPLGFIPGRPAPVLTPSDLEDVFRRLLEPLVE